MIRPRGIRARLALALLVVVAGALGAAYAVVVPSLQDRLIQAKLVQLERDAVPAIAGFPSDRIFWQRWAEENTFLVNARIVVYDVLTTNPPALTAFAAARSSGARDVESDLTADLAAATGQTQRGLVTRSGKRYAEVAVPLTSAGPVVLFVSSLSDPLATVNLVKRRLLGAAAIALFVALGLGLVAAGLHAGRIRRLERAAERIAGGRFDEPVVDGGNDELGELAAAFERMRVRVAQLDRARREFIANASHELRTPLFSLGGFLELMDDEELDEATRDEFLATMREQVERLTRLATDLLDLSRVDAGQLRVEAESVDLGSVAGALVEEFRAVAEQTQHPLLQRTTPHVDALADEQRVLQVGRALVGNAIVHTPPGTPVTLHVGRENGCVFLAVEDTGPGVAEADAPHVFDRFYRGDGTVASGSGLGLAIANELAVLMGGVVRLESEPGRTRFRLDLEPSIEPERP